MTTLKEKAAALKAQRNQSVESNTKPIGSISVQIDGKTVFTRSVWKESTSEVEFLNEINDMAVDDPESLVEILNELKTHMNFVVNTKQTSNKTLADLIK